MAERLGDSQYTLPDICARCGRVHAPLRWDETVEIVERPGLTLLALLGGFLFVTTRKVRVSLPVCHVCEQALRKCRRLMTTSKWGGFVLGAVAAGLLSWHPAQDMLFLFVVFLGLLGGCIGAIPGFVAAGVIRIVMKAKLVMVRRQQIGFRNPVFESEFSALNPDFHF